jgi:hypothetical protein
LQRFKSCRGEEKSTAESKAICNCWLRRTILDIHGEGLNSIHHEDGIGPVYRAGQFLQEAGSVLYYIHTGGKQYCSRSCYTASQPRGFKRTEKTEYLAFSATP